MNARTSETTSVCVAQAGGMRTARVGRGEAKPSRNSWPPCHFPAAGGRGRSPARPRPLRRLARWPPCYGPLIPTGMRSKSVPLSKTPPCRVAPGIHAGRRGMACFICRRLDASRNSAPLASRTLVAGSGVAAVCGPSTFPDVFPGVSPFNPT